MSSFHLNRFGTRLAVALIILAMVVLAHAGYVELVQLAGIGTLTLWVIVEARDAYASRSYGRRAPATRSPGSGEG